MRCMCAASPGAALLACARRVRGRPYQPAFTVALNAHAQFPVTKHGAHACTLLLHHARRCAVRSRCACSRMCSMLAHLHPLALIEAMRWRFSYACMRSAPEFADVQCTALAGTYLGLVEKLPYLQALGINAIELLPIHEFNELEYYQACRRRLG